MKKIKNILLIFLFALVFENKAQSNFIIAGQHGVFYYDIVPDIPLVSPPPPNGADLSYSLDINNDGINDIKIDNTSSYGGAYSSSALSITALDSNTSFSYDGQNATGTCGNETLLKLFHFGDTIQNTTTFLSSSYIWFYNNYFPPTGAGCSTQGYSSGSLTDAYIGVKYKINSSIAYGWVKLGGDSISGSNNFLIMAYSLGNFVTGIKQFADANEQLIVYPNPAKDILNVELGMLNEKTEIKLLDVLGNKVLSTTQKQIDVSNLQNGIYFVQVKTNEGILSKKIIVQK